MSNQRRTCTATGQDISHLHPNAKFISKDVALKYRNDQATIKRREKSIKEKWKCGESDLITCPICKSYKHVTISAHLRKTHDISNDEFKTKYPSSPIHSDVYLTHLSEKITGENNPGYRHGGKLSPWSDKSEVHTEEQKREARRKADENRSHTTQIDYWLNKGYSEQEAKEKLSERQKTFSKKICIEKYGKEEGLKIWKERQAKWMKSMPRQNFSAISQELFWRIVDHKQFIAPLKDVWFAELDKTNNAHDSSGTNHEKTLVLNGAVIKPDFLIESDKKIIEFDGDYWHSPRIANPTREALREHNILDAGYDLLRIKESDYRSDPKNTIQKCIEFINS